MTVDLTSDQIQKLKDLGISVNQQPGRLPSLVGNNTPASTGVNEVNTPAPSPQPVETPPELTPVDTPASTGVDEVNTPAPPSILPLLSISGLSLLSIGGLILFKTKSEAIITPTPPPVVNQQQDVAPTQVPKSIQHYLLTSQQFFSQALQLQNNQDGQPKADDVLALLNQSLLAAAQAIKDFPTDYRGYEQRGRIYQSLLDSRPELVSAAISDFQTAAHYNATSADLTKNIATLYAKKGDVPNTLTYLTRTITLDPTKAQNFYDLAQLQQQAGLLSDAATTYQQLLTLLPDPTQKEQVQNQLVAIQTLLKQNPSSKPVTSPSPEPIEQPIINPDDQLLRADTGQGLIIAAPQTSQNLQVTGQTDSNALSGTATLTPNQASYTLSNLLITDTSQVYVTQVVGGKNQTLKVLSKSIGSCTIGFDTPLDETVEFKWWIIN